MFVPVLCGSDLNAYNAARAFHEAYGVCSHVFGRYSIGATKYTRIIKFHEVENFNNPSIFIDTLNGFATGFGDGAKIILFGCTDEYVSLVARSRDLLSDKFVVPYIDAPLMDKLTLKERFYEYCAEYGIPFPKTAIYSKDEPKTLDNLGFDYPIIIKPSSSQLYWKYPFDGMKTVYRANDRSGAEKIIGEIYGSGYPDKLILQDTIPGDDSYMYVLTAYCDSNAVTRMMCLGHVLLEEHTPKGLGNHCAIVTEYNKELMEKFKAFLEAVGYVGYANFDVKYDMRDGVYKAFEINTRLGRSNYYVTATGNNTAKLLADDFIYDKRPDGCIFNEEEIYWRYIPDKIVLKYCGEKYGEKIKRLIKIGRAFSSMRYKPDLRLNPKRRIFIFLHEHNHIKKFKTYYHPDGK
jgi:D-aspartate ligase